MPTGDMRRGARRMGRLVWLGGWVLRVLLQATAAHRRAIYDCPPSIAARERVQHEFRRMLARLGVRVTVDGAWPQAPCLVTCNHISWLDIVVLGAVLPVAFLSKDEPRRWPIIGRLALAGGTLFIKRGKLGAAEHSAQEIAHALSCGTSVLVFAEGTTTDGRAVRRYFSPLFKAAIDSGAPVLPVALRYPHKDGVHPKVPYINEDLFLPSVFAVLDCEAIEARVEIGTPMESAGMERRALSEAAQQFAAERVERGLRATS